MGHCLSLANVTKVYLTFLLLVKIGNSAQETRKKKRRGNRGKNKNRKGLPMNSQRQGPDDLCPVLHSEHVLKQKVFFKAAVISFGG